jgi:LemA protein
MTITIILFAAIALILFVIWGTYNSLATGKVRIKEALSSIDVQLKRRVDLIPNLVETVKGYAKYEKEIFENVTKARSALLKAETPADKAKSNNMVTEAIKSIFAVSENYPNLRASENFKALQDELSDTENKIAYARQFYNTNVRDYNTTLVNFPGGMFGRMFGFTEAEFFGATEEEKKEVKVAF